MPIGSRITKSTTLFFRPCRLRQETVTHFLGFEKKILTECQDDPETGPDDTCATLVPRRVREGSVRLQAISVRTFSAAPVGAFQKNGSHSRPVSLPKFPGKPRLQPSRVDARRVPRPPGE